MNTLSLKIGALFLSLTLTILSAQAQPSITLTNPTNNSTLSCVTTVQVTGARGDWSYGGAVNLKIQDVNGASTVTPMNGFGDTWQYDWHTEAVDNGNYTLQGFVTFYKPGPGAPTVNAVTSLVSVVVKNGYAIVVDDAKAKTYAKVISPTPGQQIGSNFTFAFSSDHRVTYNRFDSCVPYQVKFGSYHITTNPQVPGSLQSDFTRMLPLIVGGNSLHLVANRQQFKHWARRLLGCQCLYGVYSEYSYSTS